MTPKSRSDLILVGTACRDPYGVPKWYAYVGTSLGPERTTQKSARMDLDKMMRSTLGRDRWAWGPLRILV